MHDKPWLATHGGFGTDLLVELLFSLCSYDFRHEPCLVCTSVIIRDTNNDSSLLPVNQLHTKRKTNFLHAAAAASPAAGETSHCPNQPLECLCDKSDGRWTPPGVSSMRSRPQSPKTAHHVLESLLFLVPFLFSFGLGIYEMPSIQNFSELTTSLFTYNVLRTSVLSE
ncbi:hypothetical protein B0T10DRAFT_110903 [Thelonectria olida]|uniref:Uncharacterized protein n=1 Tax=Thelonectria olida TaxID=1576542 RepID=A0A9P9AVQ8_9HYPO|nr:hypothetical protein B0T10DRAFT_110903 [Thelonectria olida]